MLLPISLEQERDNCQNQKEDKKYFGNGRGHACSAAKSEYRRHNGDDRKDDSPG